VHRLEQIVEGVHLEGANGVRIVRGDEDDSKLRTGLRPLPQAIEQRETGVGRHVDVEEHGVRRVGPHRRDRCLERRGLFDDLDLRVRCEHRSQLLAREALLIDQQDAPPSRSSSCACHASASERSGGRQAVRRRIAERSPGSASGGATYLNAGGMATAPGDRTV
jgi:hypothetical protein